MLNEVRSNEQTISRPNKVYDSRIKSTENADKMNSAKMPNKYDNISKCSCAQRVPRILLITYFRSGSSFLGDLLQQNCRTFYSFEPLHLMTEGVRIPDSRADEAFSLLSRLFDCSFPEISYYVKWALRPENRFLFKWNRLLWSRCRFRPVSCFNAAFIKDVCSKAHVRLIKTTRLHMRHVRSFLQTLDRSTISTLKIVYLVRDPRGIYNSRKNLSWCQNKTCADPKAICDELSEDLTEYRKLKSEMPDRFIMIRYEDLSLFPQVTSVDLSQQLELPFSKQAERFLHSHTAVNPESHDSEKDNPYSTRRNSVSTAVEWVSEMTAAEIDRTQSACKSVIVDLKYHYITRKDKDGNADLTGSSAVVREIAAHSNFFTPVRVITDASVEVASRAFD